MSFTELVPLPDRQSINTRAHPCPTQLLIDKFGPPRQVLTDDCQAITSSYWKKWMRTEDLGPFRATGHRLALAQFREAFAAVNEKAPKLYGEIGSAGLLCCRRVRGTCSTLSNHGLGMALDMTVGGRLDSRGDGQVQRGMLELYSILKLHGLYWGAGFPSEDAMHFEVSAETVDQWLKQGLL